MEKLPICRICLVTNVPMYVVVNKNLHELYERLTDIPFVTDDKRPILACFFCCAKLKQCFRLLQKCLKAEELFAQMMDEDYEPNSLINLDHLEFCSGFIISPINHISIVDECLSDNLNLAENIAIKKELPDDCEGLDDIIEPKEEILSDDLEPENVDNSYRDVEVEPPDHFESASEGDVPLMEFKVEVEEATEEPKMKRRAVETNNLEPENVDNSYLDVEVKPLPHFESDSEGDVPLMEFKIEVEEAIEVPKMKRRVMEIYGTRATRTIKLEDTITAELKKKEPSNLKVSRTTGNRTSKPGSCFKEPDECDQRSLNPVKKIKHSSTLCEKHFKCDVCQRSFSKKCDLIKHFRIHTGEKPFKCDVCLQYFSVKSNLTKHVHTHTGEKPFKCDVCQRRFSKKCDLIKHFRIHTGEKPFKCDVCLQCFSVKSNLTKHVRTHTGEKPYTCDVCQRSFSNMSSLTKHKRIHTGEKPYNCNVCQRSFSDKSDLTKHVRIHTGEKPFKCDVCLQCFSVKSNLTKHFRTHTGEKPYNCDVCQRSFNQSSILIKHKRIHTGEKPYNCDVCQRSFSQTNSLTKHKRIHTGEKPYNCNICQRSFSEKGSLIRHNTHIHTGLKPYD